MEEVKTGMETLEEIRAYFAQDRFAAELGIEITQAGDGCATCRATASQSQCNALGRVQGGFIFTLADFTFAVAAGSTGRPAVTLESSIHYLRPPATLALSATARPRHLGGRTCVYEVSVQDASGEPVALVTTTGYHTGGPKTQG